MIQQVTIQMTSARTYVLEGNKKCDQLNPKELMLLAGVTCAGMTAMAIMLVRIDKKLDDIQKTQKQILDFLNRDKESKLLADLDLLMEITRNYKFNFDNKEYLRTKLNLTEDHQPQRGRKYQLLSQADRGTRQRQWVHPLEHEYR